MWKAILSMESGVLRGLLVAFIGVFGLILSWFGVDEQLFGAKAQQLVDGVLLLLTAGSVFYAAYKRTNSPNPNLTPAADKEEVRLINDGTIPETKATVGVLEVAKAQRGSARPAFLGMVALFMMVALAACSMFQTRDFNDRADIAYDAAKEGVAQVRGMLTAKEITPDQAEQAVDGLEHYADAVGLARSAYKVSQADGEAQLKAIHEGVRKLLDDLKRGEQP